MSKKFKISIFALLMLLCMQSGVLQAQGDYILPGYRHNVAVWLGAGYSRLGHSINQTFDITSQQQGVSLGTKIPGGFGGLLGVGYQGNFDKFMFLAGVEFNFLNSKTSFTNISQDVSYLYTPMNHDIVFHYKFNKFSDVQNAGYINIPISVGYRFSDLFYAMLGAKYGLNLLGNYSSKGTFSTTANDPQFIDEMTNIPNHGIVNEKETEPSKGTLKFNGNILGSIEVGVYLDKWIYGAPQRRDRQGNYEKRNSYRVGLFADYGLADIHNYDVNNLLGMGNSLVQYPTMKADGFVDPANVKTNSAFQSKESFGKKVNSMLVGVKLTVLFDLTPDRQIVRPPRPRFTAQVVDSQTGEGIPAQLSLKNAQGRQVGKLTANRKTGIASRLLAAGNYSLDVTMNDYEPFTDNVSPTTTPDTVVVRLVHKPVLTVKAIDSETKLPLVADITISDAKTGKQIFRAETDKTSNAVVRTVEKGDYILSAAVQGYISNSANVTAQGQTTTTIELDPIKPEVPIVLKNLFFDFNKATIQPQSEPELLKLYELLKDNPTIKINIVGHTDNVGTDAYNDKLSLDRAKSVYNEMVKRGIDKSRMTFEGKGKRVPVCTTDDGEECRAENRRVEFTITEK